MMLPMTKRIVQTQNRPQILRQEMEKVSLNARKSWMPLLNIIVTCAMKIKKMKPQK